MKRDVNIRAGKFLEAVIEEDIGRGDLFARVADSGEARAQIVAKSEGVFAGYEYISQLESMFEIKFVWNIKDGDAFHDGMIMVEIFGKSQILLSLERSILNIIMHASSIASLCRKYVDKISKYECRLLDTRKTRPLLRDFEKYAVRCGGGVNHRMGLDDCLMIKDTHLKTIDDLDSFIMKIRKKIPFTSKIEIECENIDMAVSAMEAGADIIMCDNMKAEDINAVVAYRDSNYPRVLVEASGNITLDNIEEVAKTRIDAISTGSIIHQAQWPDMSMRIIHD